MQNSLPMKSVHGDLCALARQTEILDVERHSFWALTSLFALADSFMLHNNAPRSPPDAHGSSPRHSHLLLVCHVLDIRLLSLSFFSYLYLYLYIHTQKLRENMQLQWSYQSNLWSLRKLYHNISYVFSANVEYNIQSTVLLLFHIAFRCNIAGLSGVIARFKTSFREVIKK